MWAKKLQIHCCFWLGLVGWAMPSSTSVKVLQGDAMAPFVDELAALRIRVFRAWPYLYDGDLDNERDYLAAFTRSPSSTMVVAFGHLEGTQKVVGVSTAMALANESRSIRRPFERAGLDVREWFYLAESVLLPEFRGQGLGHAFFDQREAAGRKLGFDKFAFCGVVRSADDPRRPVDARQLEPFWAHRGYAPMELCCHLRWKEVGHAEASDHELRFWSKSA
jgi:GNAT superfamily N-acetyltransferase